MRNLKRALSLLLSSTMVLGMVVMGGSAAGYQDVDDTYHKEAIEVLQAAGIMTGVDSAGNFNPNGTVTRNEMAVIMSNLMAYNVATYSGTSPFTDVPSWAEPYVAACWTNGITAGTSETTYGGDQTVTTAQAALMIMKALGYFQYQSDFGGDWQLSTVSQGNKIDLFTDVNSGVKEAMTRNDVAQLVLNGLESGTVEAETNGSITVGDITIVNDVKYNFITSGQSYAKAIDGALYTNNDGTTSTGSIVELGEKLYQGDLMKKGGQDDFGRPASIWSYNNKEIGTYADEADYTYTKSISEKDLYNELGAAVVGYTWDVYYNGQDLGSVKPDKNKTDDYSKTATGTLTEVFVDNVDKTVTVTMVDTFLAEVIRVSDDGKTVTVNYLGDQMANTSGRQTSYEVDSTNLVEGDKVLVTLYKDGTQFSIGSMEKAQTVTGNVTAVKSIYDQNVYKGKYAVMDDKQYNYVGNTFAEDLADTDLVDPTLNAENTLYLDAYGNMIAFEATERSVNYLYVQDDIQDLNSAKALVTFPDGTEETIAVTKLTYADNNGATPSDWHTVEKAGNTIANKLVSGIYAYVKQGSNYELTQLVDNNWNSATGVAEEVWDGTPVDRSFDNGTTGGTVGSGDLTYAGQTVDYAIKNGLNAIQVTYNGTTTRNIVSLTNSTIFVDVEGGKIYTGYSNVPTMTDISFYVVYNKQLNADVVFITDGADNSTSDSYFYITDGTPVVTKKDADGTEYYEYQAIVNGVQQAVTFKGTKYDNSTPAQLIAKNTLYKIETITPDGFITKASRVTGFTTTFNAANSYATDLTSGTFRIYNTGAELSGCTNNAVSGYTNQYIYKYDSDTVFVNVELKADGTVNKVSQASANIVNANSTTDNKDGFNNVYVITVDDTKARTPKATLVYVVTPHESTFAKYTVTYPVAGEYAANITGVTVNSGSVADGAQVTNGTSLNIVATAATGYDAAIYVNGDKKGLNSATVSVAGNTDITVVAEKQDTTKGTTVQGISDAGGALTLLYTESQPTGADALNKVVAEVLAAGYTADPSGMVSPAGGTNYNIKVMKGYMPVTFTFDTSSGIKQGLTGMVNGKETLVASGTALSALSGAATGTFYQAASNTGLGTPNDFVVDGKTYVASSAQITGKDFDVTISTGYVKVTGADATGVAQVGEDYTVPAKTAFAGAKGTGVEYTINSTKKYAAYEGTISSSEIDGTHDITLAASFVKVTVTITDSKTPTETFTITPASAGNPLSAAGETYAKAAQSAGIKIASGGSDTDLYIKTTGLSADETGKADFDQDSGKDLETMEADITITIQNESF